MLEFTTFTNGIKTFLRSSPWWLIGGKFSANRKARNDAWNNNSTHRTVSVSVHYRMNYIRLGIQLEIGSSESLSLPRKEPNFIDKRVICWLSSERLFVFLFFYNSVILNLLLRPTLCAWEKSFHMLHLIRWNAKESEIRIIKKKESRPIDFYSNEQFDTKSFAIFIIKLCILWIVQISIESATKWKIEARTKEGEREGEGEKQVTGWEPQSIKSGRGVPRSRVEIKSATIYTRIHTGVHSMRDPMGWMRDR